MCKLRWPSIHLNLQTMTPSRLRLVGATLHRTATKTRMPFRFGIAVMTEAPHVFLKGTFEIGGKTFTGIAADGLLPKWFDKSPDKGAQQELDELLLVIRQAVTLAPQIPACPRFEFWRQLYGRQTPSTAQRGVTPLLIDGGITTM